MPLMKKFILPYLVLAAGVFSLPAFSQNNEDSVKLLGLPGDNLDLYAVLTLFQKSKTIEAFEKDLNLKETGINNLDLDLDKKVDFIKVATKMEKDSSFTFTLQVDVTKEETQDVASILLDKDKKGKISLQIVGAEALYGKDYVIEPKGNSPVTPNPAYTGTDPVTVTVPATTVVVETAPPIVQYVYSPAYVPYYPPYYYGYYPPYHFAFTVMAIGIYHNSCYHYHGGYHGGHYGGGNTVIINNGNRNNINHNNSNIVNNNRQNGKYGNGVSNRQGNRNTAGTRPSTSNNKTGAGNRPSTGNASARPSTSQGKVGSSSSANRPSMSNNSSYNRPSSNGASRSMSSGGRTMSSGAAMSRGGGGGGRRR